MKIALLAILCLAAAVAALVTGCRRQPSSHASPQANALLRAYLSEGRDYRFFVGVPLQAPVEWKQAQKAGETLAVGDEPLDLDTITAFLVVYPNGEVLSWQHEFFPLPRGVKFVEQVADPKQDVLDPSVLAEGEAFVSITFGPSRSRPSEPGHYSTTIQNTSDKKLRVTKFAGFTKFGGAFRLNTISGDYFSADQFISWYGAPEDGWIAPGGIAADPHNYGSGNGYWVYYFETEDGKEFAAGAQNPQ